MNADVFIDTNILLYTIDEDPASAEKRERAQQLILSERWGWSIQVASEFFVNATSQNDRFAWLHLQPPNWWKPGLRAQHSILRPPCSGPQSAFNNDFN